MKNNSLWELLAVFAPLSLLTIGGGQSVLADIQKQTVFVHHWLSESRFLDDFAIARASAGPFSLIVSLIGWQVGGFWGAVITSVAIFLPSSILFYVLTVLWRRQTGQDWQKKLSKSLAPISVGLVLAGSYSILVADGGGLFGWAITGTVTLTLLLTRVHPMALLACGGSAFLLRSLIV
jgi:chromate transporter